MERTAIATSNAPAAIGPYSQAIDAGHTVFVSGQLPICPVSGAMADGVAAQTHQSLENIAAILKQAGLGMDSVVKTTVLMQDLGGFAEMNEVYGQFFSGTFPARAAYQVAKLPKDALVEIEAVAVRR